MAVTARFVVSRVAQLGGYTQKDGVVVPPWGVEVEMTPDYALGANEEWSEATPSGVFRLTINTSKTDALDQLPVGAKLHITIEPQESE